MKTQQQIEILENAELAGLEKIEITYGSNGYPKGLGDYGVIGFNTFEDAEKFAEENDCKVHLFQIRDGHSLWENRGAIYRALTSEDYLKDLGENYFYADNNNDSYREILEDLAQKFDGDFSYLKAYIATVEEIQNEVEKCCDDEIVIIANGLYFETVKKEIMSYHEDVTRYVLGVFVERMEEED